MSLVYFHHRCEIQIRNWTLIHGNCVENNVSFWTAVYLHVQFVSCAQSTVQRNVFNGVCCNCNHFTCLLIHNSSILCAKFILLFFLKLQVFIFSLFCMINCWTHNEHYYIKKTGIKYQLLSIKEKVHITNQVVAT